MSQQLTRGISEFVEELVKRFSAGEVFDNPKLKRLADQFFGGTRIEGVYTPRDAYDTLETAVNKFLFETMAHTFIGTDKALPKLRALLARLPTQTARTVEQT